MADTPDIQLPIPLSNPPEGKRDFASDYSNQYSSSDTPSGNSYGAEPAYKPFAFALRPAPNNAIHIRFGSLVSQINRLEIDDTGVVYQAGITNPEVHTPANFEGQNESRYSYAVLPWRGDVYLYWETDCDGVVTLCDIRGPEQPEGSGSDTGPESVPLPNNGSGGKFHIKLGTVDDYDIPNIRQDISSDVYWISTFEGKCSSSSSSSSSSSDSFGSSDSGSGFSDSSSSSASDSGSDKSTAIVPMAWHDKGYGALFTMESNEVLFEFVMRNVPLTGAETRARIDDRFLAVCELGSMVITGIAGDRAGSVGAVVEENEVVLSAWPLSFLRPTKVTLKLTGVRKGFKHLDMPERSRAQFEANERFINSAYPRS